MTVAQIVLDRKRFVEQDTFGFQRVDQPWKQRAVEIVGHEDDVIGIRGEFRAFIGRPFEIDLFDGEMGKMPLRCRRCKRCQTFPVTIDGVYFKAVGSQIQRMTSAAAGDIERSTFG